MKILFLFMPAYGHIQPTLGIANELINRGEQIVYFTTEEFKEKIEDTGAKVVVIDNKFGVEVPKMNGAAPTTERPTPDKLLNIITTHLKEGASLTEHARAEAPDGIVYDPMCLWSRAMISELKIPRVLFYSGIVVTPDSPIFESYSQMMNGAIPYEFIKMFMVKECLNLAPIPPQFQPESPFIDKTYHFIGPAVQENVMPLDKDIDEIKEQQIVYISLGSIINNPHFYEICIEAFKDTDWKIIMVAKEIPDHVEIPSNFIIRPFVNQTKVLSISDIFISHGGVNSVMESLWYGVPLVLVPQSSDQPLVAKRVEELGLGSTLEFFELTPPILKETTERTYTDPEVRNKVARMRNNLQGAESASKGAALIQNYIYQTVLN